METIRASTGRRKKCKFCDKTFEKSTSLNAGANHYDMCHRKKTGNTPPRKHKDRHQNTPTELVIDLVKKEEINSDLMDWMVDDEQSFAVLKNKKFLDFVGEWNSTIN